MKFKCSSILLLFMTIGMNSYVCAAAIDFASMKPGHWYEIPNTNIKDVFPDPAPPGSTGPRSVVRAWSGGAFDTKRERLIVWGGGHGNYSGNELYVFDINSADPKWQRLTEPSMDVGGDEASGLYPDGLPRSRHTYNFVEYIPPADEFCSFGAGGTYPSSTKSLALMQCYNFKTNSWESGVRKDVPYGDRRGVVAYDPVTNNVWYRAAFSNGLYMYNPNDDAWSNKYGNDQYLRYLATAAIDTERHQMVAVGNNQFFVWDLDNPGTATIPARSGAVGIESTGAPGFQYDSSTDKFVAWNGGADVHILDPATWTWSIASPSATNTVIPPAMLQYGTFGRFRYIQSKNVFILYNDHDQNVYFYKLSEGAGGIDWPNISLTTSKSSIESGESVNLSWAVANGSSCTASGDWSGDKATSGSITTGPIVTNATFTLTCAGTVGFATVSVNVIVGEGTLLPISLTSPSTYTWAKLENNTNVYIDRSYSYSSIPAKYNGLDVLQTANDDKASSGDGVITFNVAEPVMVYVAHTDTGSSLPSWLLDWTPTGEQLGTTDRSLYLYSKNFPAGTVSLGGNDTTTSMYTVVLAAAGGAISGDTDGDGMLDDWELSYFGNLDRNGTQDLDGDGLSDLEEYHIDTNPTLTDSDGDGDSDFDEVAYGSNPNLGTDTIVDHSPATPSILAIGSGVSISRYTFDVSDFSDPDGDALGSSHWQIGTDSSFDSLILDRTLDGIESLVIGQGILKSNTSYAIRTRHQDSSGLWSDWSASTAFNTANSDVNDVDHNGIDDRYQVSGPVDTDNNGISDSDEGMCNLTDADGAQVLGLRSSMGTVQCFSVLSEAELPPGSTTADFPFGMFSFGIEGLPVDANNPATVNLTIYFAEPLPVGTRWYVFDPSTGIVTDYTSNISINDNAMVVTLTDGGVADFDGVVNGVIVDPSGPSFSTSDGGGSSISGDDSGGGGSIGLFEFYFGLMGLLLSLAIRSKKNREPL